MASRFIRLSFVLVVFGALTLPQACAHRAGDSAAVKQGCCWKKEGTTVTCSAPTLKRDCTGDFTWVEGKSCRDKECGGA